MNSEQISQLLSDDGGLNDVEIAVRSFVALYHMLGNNSGLVLTESQKCDLAAKLSTTIAIQDLARQVEYLREKLS